MLTAMSLSEGNISINHINLMTFKNITLLQSKAPHNLMSKFQTLPSSSNPYTLLSYPTSSLFILFYLQINVRAFKLIFCSVFTSGSSLTNPFNLSFSSNFCTRSWLNLIRTSRTTAYSLSNPIHNFC